MLLYSNSLLEYDVALKKLEIYLIKLMYKNINTFQQLNILFPLASCSFSTFSL